MTSFYSFRRFAAVLLGGALMLAARDGAAATRHVAINALNFSPSHITIAVGDTVVWTSNYSDEFGGVIISAPSVTPTGANSFTGCAAVPKGHTCEATFDTEGVFTYRNLDFGMFAEEASITVRTNVAPGVNVTMPTGEQTIVVGESVGMTGNFFDNDGTVDSVEFFVVNASGTNAVVATAVITMGTNFAMSAAATGFIAGTNALMAVATDDWGGEGTAVVNVTAQANGDPTAAITVLRLNAALDELTVGVVATDPEADAGGGVPKVEFFFNDVLHETINSVTATNTYFTTRIPVAMLISDGLNTLGVAVEDAAGNTNGVTTTFLTSILPLTIDATASSFVVNASTVSFNFDVGLGVQYRVETSTNLADWTTRFTFTPTVTPHPYIELRSAEGLRFYRVVRDP
ncbi:MAG: plastocyanin [Candidatus Binatia bacterium]|jgi:plastocyanin